MASLRVQASTKPPRVFGYRQANRPPQSDFQWSWLNLPGSCSSSAASFVGVLTFGTITFSKGSKGRTRALAQCPDAPSALLLPWGDPRGCFTYSSTISCRFLPSTPLQSYFYPSQTWYIRAVGTLARRHGGFALLLLEGQVETPFIIFLKFKTCGWLMSHVLSLFSAPFGTSCTHVSGLTRVSRRRRSYGRLAAGWNQTSAKPAWGRRYRWVPLVFLRPPSVSWVV